MARCAAMWAGVVARSRCSASAIAVALQLVDRALPQQQQEGLETVVAAVAVAMVTFMIVWMRRHAARPRGASCARSAAGALARGSALGARRRWRSSPSSARASRPPSSCSPPSRPPATRVRRRAARSLGDPRRGRDRLRASTAAGFGSTSAASSASRQPCSCSSRPAWSRARSTPRTRPTWLNSLQGRAVDLSWLVQPGSVIELAADRRARRSAAADRRRGDRLARLRVPMLSTSSGRDGRGHRVRRVQQAPGPSPPSGRRGDAVTCRGAICRGRAALAVAALAAGCGESGSAAGSRGEGADA